MGLGLGDWVRPTVCVDRHVVVTAPVPPIGRWWGGGVGGHAWFALRRVVVWLCLVFGGPIVPASLLVINSPFF